MRQGIVAFCMLALSLPPASANASVHIDLPGNYDGWMPTAVVLAVGDTLRITATGCICWANYVCPSVDETNPDGRYCWDTTQWPVEPPGFLCDDGTELSLVGKIGDSPCFTVGSAFSMVVSNAGQLFLAYNDRPGGWYDNLGAFSIEVGGSVPPPTGACCFPDTYCIQLTRTDCVGAGGTYMGDGVPCDLGLCTPTAVEPISWGRVKAFFR